MPLVYMIRHGEAAAGWDADPDPGLSAQGREQAVAAAHAMVTRLGQTRLSILSSPLRRCRETAERLAHSWNMELRIEPRVIEIPSPVTDLKARHLWLRGIMKGSWIQADATADVLPAWRAGIVEALTELQEDTVVFTHFIAINAAVAHALGDSRVVYFMPDNCSLTLLETDGRMLRLIEKGCEMETRVN